MKLLSLLIISILISASSAFAVEVTPFVAPYNSYSAAHEFFTTAEKSITASVYILSSPDIASMLADLEKKGVKVDILVEGGPVGGIADFKPVLCALQEAGIEIKLYTGDLRFIHAKYAIKDSSEVLIATENFASTSFSWKKAGNKGYGMVIKDPVIASQLLQIYQEDLQDSKNLDCAGIDSVELKSYPIPSETLVKINADSVELVVTPLDSAGIEKISALLRNSKTFLYIEQQYIQHWGNNQNPFLEAVLQANARIRIMLDNSWYSNQEGDEDSNTAIAEEINQIASKQEIDAIAKVYEGKKYERIHAKAVFSEKYAFISSINWNENSPTNNREIGIIAYGSEPVNYYKPFFEADFENKNQGADTIQNPFTGFAITENKNLLIAAGVLLIIIILIFAFRKRS